MVTGLLIFLALLGFGWLFATDKEDVKKRNSAKIPDAISEKSLHLDRMASRFNIPPKILKAVAWVESAGKQSARGSAGEIGVMQLKKIATQDVRQFFPDVNTTGWKKDWKDNVRVGAAYLRLQYRRTGDWQQAVKAYNQGFAGSKKNPEKAAAYMDKVNKRKKFF